MKADYHSLPTQKVIKKLKSKESGLNKKEAHFRLKRFGYNQLKRKKKISPCNIFLSQFKSVIIWILIAAVIISLILKHNIDAVIIAIILIGNAILGFIQEYKSEKAIEALKKLTALKAKVLRDGKEKQIIADYLVPGDIIILSEGDIVPADSRIIENNSLQTQESSLTGESTPIMKSISILKPQTALAERKNMAYSGTIVVAGKAKAIVAATGMKSEIGKIAGMIEKIEEGITPLQKRLKDLGKYFIYGTIIIAFIVLALGLIQGTDFMEMLITSVALAVAAIPEGLPAVVTISLAIAIQKMTKRNSLIRKLPSVETLGSTTVICTDKTGTLTLNQMAVRKIYANRNVFDIQDNDGIKTNRLLFEIGALCNDAELDGKNAYGDPTETALLSSAKIAGITQNILAKKYPRMGGISFTSEKKYMATFHKISNNKYTYIKGAPDIILKKCSRIYDNGKVKKLTNKEIKRIKEVLDDFSDSSLRVLSFAFKEGHSSDLKDLVFVGLQGMIDPPRPEVKDAIKKCKAAGIRVVMVTGDYKRTAQAIGKEIGLTGKALSGSEIDKINDLSKIIEEVNIFARVNPSHKLKIINALKKKNQIVAMTGDGVNDAPALKTADIGVAMGISGTDVAKEASDMILVDDNFASIVNAIEEGRGVYNNIKKFIGFLLSCNLAEVMIIFLASLFGWPLPFIAIQILWINLVTDGLPALALSADRTSHNVMHQNPRNPNEHIITKPYGIKILILSALVTALTLIIFKMYIGKGLMLAQTMAFSTIVVLEMVVVYVIRAHFVDRILKNKFLIGSVIISILLQAIVLYTPLAYYFKVLPLALEDWKYILIAAVFLGLMGIVVDKVITKVNGKAVA
ncbi:MAG: calcium-translocating P-type ATPase, PMCA-type [Nanoarchaeota archaeon]|nr:calcium-translocating P-type ATPase, PMCA-type [Nanoarchaeota archaeon]